MTDSVEGEERCFKGELSGDQKRIEVRWRDLDAVGHVNNAVYFTYLEERRREWLARVLGDDGDIMEFTLARVEIDYRRELSLGDEVVVTTSIGRIGRSSIHTIEQILAKNAEVAAEAAAVIVARDCKTHRARRLRPIELGALQREFERSNPSRINVSR